MKQVDVGLHICMFNLFLIASFLFSCSTACPLFREFRNTGKFAKITGHEYLNGNLAYCVLGCSQNFCFGEV